MKILFCLTSFFVGLLVTVTVHPKNGESSESLVAIQESASQTAGTKQEPALKIEKNVYGVTSDGAKVTQFTCTNKNGLVLEMIDYGATVTAFKTPDRNGDLANITLHCNDIAGYQACTSYFGGTVGRFCNRIARGKFSIDGIEYELATNNGPNHLHGGNVGFDKRIWKAEQIKGDDFVGVSFSLVSEDGDEGYPGKLKVTANYTLNNADELTISFNATTDKPTHINLTNHNYWNLSGAGSGTIFDHLLKLESDKYLSVDKTSIPTGEFSDAKGTAFDFIDFHPMGERLKIVGGDPFGYDHCYALRSTTGQLALAATVTDPASGRVMEILTTQPGIQFYTGNFLDGQPGSGGFAQHSAFCLETQHFPDAPNQPKFASTLLEPDHPYFQKTVHKFRVVD